MGRRRPCVATGTSSHTQKNYGSPSHPPVRAPSAPARSGEHTRFLNRPERTPTGVNDRRRAAAFRKPAGRLSIATTLTRQTPFAAGETAVDHQPTVANMQVASVPICVASSMRHEPALSDNGMCWVYLQPHRRSPPSARALTTRPVGRPTQRHHHDRKLMSKPDTVAWSSSPSKPAAPWACVLAVCSDATERAVRRRHHLTSEPAESRTNRHRSALIAPI